MSEPVRSIAVCVARNAEDIIAFSVLHHLLAGVDRCVVVDNGSSDRTAEILQAIARRTGRVEVVDDCGPSFGQADIVNRVVNEFTERGETLVIPFDADEFWTVTRADLARNAGRPAGALRCPVINFVQSRAAAVPSRWSWLRAYRRARVVPGDERALVLARRHSFVEVSFSPKVIFRAAGRVELGVGAHSVRFDGATSEARDGVACLHLPLRARVELIKRAYDYEPRRAPLRSDPGQSWQSFYWWQEVGRGRTEDEWRANSYDRQGNLDVFGRRVPTFRDFGLVRLLCRAYAYGMVLNVPMGPKSFVRYAEPTTR
jgi:hypothetical protein